MKIVEKKNLMALDANPTRWYIFGEKNTYIVYDRYYSFTGGSHVYIQTDARANSKQFIEELKQVEKIEGKKFHDYEARRNYAEVKSIKTH